MLIAYFGSLLALYLLLMMWRPRKELNSGKWYLAGASLVLTFLLLEIGLNIYFYTTTGNWIFLEYNSENTKVWEEHPYLIGSNKKNIQAEISTYKYTHNSDGYRGTEFGPKGSETRIAAIGASTTYGVAVNDNETWPYYLDSLLGSGYEVLNLGVPCYSTIEHIIQTNLYLKKFSPDIILLHVGLNDLRASHVNNLAADYSNFQAPGLFGSMGFCYREKLPKLATLRAFIIIFQKIGWYPTCLYHQMDVSGQKSANVDTTVLKMFNNNIETLVYTCDRISAKIYFVPQVVNKQKFNSQSYEWWIPYIEPESIENQYAAFNKVLASNADRTKNHIYIHGVENEEWLPTDFCDPVHLNPTGNLKIASLIAASITSQ